MWSSTASAVASVSSQGVVTAHDNGTASIAAAVGEVADTIEVTVDQEPAQLAVGPPQGSDVAAGLTISFEVTVEDALGTRVPGSTPTITIALDENGQDAVLTGTLTADAVDGIATFDDLQVSRAGRVLIVSASAGTLTGESAPFEVRLRLGSITVGQSMACGLSHAGDAYCWGRNATGGLGVGFTGDRSRPTLVTGDLTFTQVDAGSASNINGIKDGGGCGIIADGTAYCWGRNEYGQLGDGNGGTDSNGPVAVSGGITFQTIQMGRDHACGLDETGTAYCWGFNVIGQLGDGNIGTDSDVPVPVAGSLTFAAIWVGDNTTCARTDGGEIYCWGGGGPNQLPGQPTVDEPTLLEGRVAFMTVSPGPFLHMCGAADGGAGYCWGQDSGGGELGTGNPGQNEEFPTLVTGGHTWTYIGAGSQSSCGLRQDGVALCWGNDTNGDIGQGAVGVIVSTPTPIVGGLTLTQLSVAHSIACGLTANGDAYCWGSGIDGERGDGTTELHGSTPTKVLNP